VIATGSGAALFEVTQPRVTCYRVGIRMNEPQMAALLVAHGRPGFYFRVLEKGEVEAGDEIVQAEAGPERISVAEVNALLYLPGQPFEICRSSVHGPTFCLRRPFDPDHSLEIADEVVVQRRHLGVDETGRDIVDIDN
jgi:MOSC domain